jgi:CheY-like chemotaxis protein
MNGEPPKANPPPADGAPPPKRIRVLHVDDEESYTRLLKLNLERTGKYEVRVENYSPNAVQAAREFKPHVVLLDIIMPVMFGGDVANQFANDPELKHIPIIFFSAAVTRQRIEERGGILIGGCPEFSVGELVDLPLLASRLKQKADALSSYLQGQLSTATLSLLTNYQGLGSDPVALQAALVEDFNRIIRGPLIFNKDRFAGITLRLETQRILERSLQGDALLRLNRLLLQDVYPLEISRKVIPYPFIPQPAELEEVMATIDRYTTVPEGMRRCSKCNRLVAANVPEDQCPHCIDQPRSSPAAVTVPIPPAVTLQAPPKPAMATSVVSASAPANQSPDHWPPCSLVEALQYYAAIIGALLGACAFGVWCLHEPGENFLLPFLVLSISSAALLGWAVWSAWMPPRRPRVRNRGNKP